MRMKLATAFAATMLIASTVSSSGAENNKPFNFKIPATKPQGTPQGVQNKPFDLGIKVVVPASVQSGAMFEADMYVTNNWNDDYPPIAPLLVAAGGDPEGKIEVKQIKWMTPSMAGQACQLHTSLGPPDNIVGYCQGANPTKWLKGKVRTFRVAAKLIAPAPTQGSTASVDFCAYVQHDPDGWEDKNPADNLVCSTINILAPVAANEYDLGIKKICPTEVKQGDTFDCKITITNRHSKPLKIGTVIAIEDNWNKPLALQNMGSTWTPSNKFSASSCGPSGTGFACSATLKSPLIPNDEIILKSTFKALKKSTDVENCAKLLPIAGMTDVDQTGNPLSQNSSCDDLNIVGASAQHDVDVKVEMVGGPKWNLASPQKVRMNVFANTIAPYTAIPVGKVVKVEADLSRGLRVDSAPIGSGWNCTWGVWDDTKPTKVTCELKVSGSQFTSSSFDIQVTPGLNQDGNGFRQELATATASLGLPLVDVNAKTASATPVDITGIGMGVNISASNSGKWKVGSPQTLTLQPIIGNIFLLKEWLSKNSSELLVIENVLSSHLEFVKADGTGWTCVKTIVSAATKVKCTYAPTVSGQISYPVFVEPVTVSVNVLSAGKPLNAVHCTQWPTFYLPLFGSRPFKPYICNSGSVQLEIVD